MNSPKVMNGYTNFETLIAPPSVLNKYDWVKHVDPSLLKCYTTITGAVTMLMSSVLPLPSWSRSQRKAAYGTRDTRTVPLDSILASVYTVCKWWFLNTWCSYSSTHTWNSDRKAWVSFSTKDTLLGLPVL
jgi:hypothetical protein